MTDQQSEPQNNQPSSVTAVAGNTLPIKSSGIAARSVNCVVIGCLELHAVGRGGAFTCQWVKDAISCQTLHRDSSQRKIIVLLEIDFALIGNSFILFSFPLACFIFSILWFHFDGFQNNCRLDFFLPHFFPVVFVIVSRIIYLHHRHHLLFHSSSAAWLLFVCLPNVSLSHLAPCFWKLFYCYFHQFSRMVKKSTTLFSWVYNFVSSSAQRLLAVGAIIMLFGFDWEVL